MAWWPFSSKPATSLPSGHAPSSDPVAVASAPPSAGPLAEADGGGAGVDMAKLFTKSGAPPMEELLERRIVCLGRVITDELANMCVAQILYLASRSRDPIDLFVRTDGGSVLAALAIYDAVASHRAIVPIRTTGVGLVGGTGVLLVDGGEPGLRRATASAQFVPGSIFHKDGGTSELRAKELAKLTTRLEELMARETGRSKPFFNGAASFSAAEARDLGIVDEIVEGRVARP